MIFDLPDDHRWKLKKAYGAGGTADERRVEIQREKARELLPILVSTR